MDSRGGRKISSVVVVHSNEAQKADVDCELARQARSTNFGRSRIWS